MVKSKIWAVLINIKKYDFKFVLLGDLDNYHLENTNIMFKIHNYSRNLYIVNIIIKKNYRAMNDPEFKIFLNDIIREGGQIQFN